VIAGGLAGVLAAITLGTTFITPETRQRDLTRLPDARDDVRAAVAIER
jgi:hypothetical protein